jgi:hypothetical protein
VPVMLGDKRIGFSQMKWDGLHKIDRAA